MDSDRELVFAKFEMVVRVFRRPDIDSERDSSDQNEDCDESLHRETPLFEIVVFCARDRNIRFRGIISCADFLNMQGRQPLNGSIRAEPVR